MPVNVTRNASLGAEWSYLGSRSSSETPSDSDEAEITADAKQRILGIGIREMKTGAATTLGDVTSRQLAYTLAGTFPWLLPADMLELGGELESR